MKTSVGPTLPISEETRFWSKVEIGSDDECWLWLASRNKRYGQFKLDGLMRKAHRVAYFLNTGEWPPVVMHKCDNPICVNPNHLVGGTQYDNVQDCIAKGRAKFPPPGAHPCVKVGARSNRALLTDVQVRNIRLALMNGIKVRDLSALFDVSLSTIYAIKSGRNWSYLS